MDPSIGQEFLRRTQFEFLSPSDESRGLPQPPLQSPNGPSAGGIDLPPREELRSWPLDLSEAIHRRASVRQYAPSRLSLHELAYLLWCTQGVKRVLPGRATLRTVPSAGARHALETYLMVQRVEPVPPGLYRFLAIERRLLSRSTDPGLMERLTQACLGQDFVRDSAVVFLWVADAYRMAYRYGERGYRYLFLDAGHACQNLYLAGEAVGAGVCAIGAYDDARVNGLLGLDGSSRFAIYLAAVGKKP